MRHSLIARLWATVTMAFWPIPRFAKMVVVYGLGLWMAGDSDMIFTLTTNQDGLIDWIYIMRSPDKLPRR